MDSEERSFPKHWRVEDILGHLNDNVDKNNAEVLLHCILTSTDILTWNLQGEIVYKGQNIRGTNIVDLCNKLFYHIILKFQNRLD